MNERGKDGKTLRETCEAVEAQEGYTPAELLDAPDIPAGFEYLWAWFIRLNSTRPPSMGGQAAISEMELRSFFLNRSITPEGWEVDLLVQLDQLSRAEIKPPSDEE